MAYWISVCPRDVDPGPQPLNGGYPNCAKSEFVTVEVQMMVVPPAGSSYDGFWQLGSIGIDDALVVSTSIAVLWALAWGIREVRNSLSARATSDEE